MSGRKMFAYSKWLITFLSIAIKIIPKFLRVFLWDIVSPFSQIVFIGIRYIIFKSMVYDCGDNIRIGKNVTILGWKKLKVGSNVSIHDNCYIDAEGGIQIGNKVSIAHATSIISFEHTWDNKFLPIKYNPIKTAPVIIEDDVWIGCGCRLLSGIHIFTRTIIAAGAVVTKDCETNSLYGGVPARKIKNL